VRRWKGVYRVVITGFKVNRATMDDPAQLDGKWDEVLVSAESRAYDASGNVLGEPATVWSKVHGDINAEQWRTELHPQHRIQAGSASSFGGLKTGDAVPGPQPWSTGNAPSDQTFPLLVWEGVLAEGQQTVEIVPIVWEADRIPQYVNQPRPALGLAALDLWGRIQAARIQINASAQGATLSATVPPAAAATVLPGAPWAVRAAAERRLLPPIPLLRGGRIDAAQLRFKLQSAGSDLDDLLSRYGLRAEGIDFSALQQAATSALAAYVSTMQSGLVAMINNRDRPIGMVTGSSTGFSPTTFILNFGFAEESLLGNGPEGLGPGVTSIRYADAMAVGGAGDYTVFLRIERLQ